MKRMFVLKDTILIKEAKKNRGTLCLLDSRSCCLNVLQANPIPSGFK